MLTASAAIRDALDAGQDPRWILGLALEARDRCGEAIAKDCEAVDGWQARPSTGDLRWDTLLTALVRHEFDQAGHLDAGASQGPPAPLIPEWTPAPSAWRTFEEARAQTPLWLSEYGIVLAEHDLQTL